MAGDWIKMRHDLPDDPAVITIAHRLGVDRDAVIGKVYRLWVWFDKHSVDGRIMHLDSTYLDQFLNLDGIADVLVQVGWLKVQSDCLTLPRFDRHMGETAKKRALDSARKGRKRTGHLSEECPGDNRTKLGTEKRREEERREEESQKKQLVLSSEETPPSNQNGVAELFVAFWEVWPNKVAKKKAESAYEKAVLGDRKKPDADLAAKILAAVAVQTETDQWQRGFVPHAATWLNGEQWLDEVRKPAPWSGPLSVAPESPTNGSRFRPPSAGDADPYAGMTSEQKFYAKHGDRIQR